jgi:3-oxoadipate enol-lactonase
MKVKTNGIELHYTVEGKGPWVVMSHSLACASAMWDEQAALLARNYKVLRFDTRGHGASDAPAGEYTLDMLAEDVHGLFRTLGIERCHWVGLSMGGMIGQTFALKFPGVFASMVLADTTSRYAPEAWPMWLQRIKLAQDKGMESLVQTTLARWFTEPFRTGQPGIVARIGAQIRATPVSGYVGCCHAITKINVTARLNKISCPVLVIVGEQDAGTPVELARAIHAAIPGSKLVIIPSAAHLSNVEQPAAFNRELGAFLEQHRSA